MDSNDVVLLDVRGHPIEKLEDADWSCRPRDLLILNRTDHEVINVFELQEVVNLPIKGVLMGK